MSDASARCTVCDRRLPIVPVQCRCRAPLCRRHVAPEQHGCSFDYRAEGRALVRQRNPRIRPEQL